jgi:hypothetical protein
MVAAGLPRRGRMETPSKRGAAPPLDQPAAVRLRGDVADELPALLAALGLPATAAARSGAAGTPVASAPGTREPGRNGRSSLAVASAGHIRARVD